MKVKEEWHWEGRAWIWKNFLEEFKLDFIPHKVRKEKEKEFLSLCQGDTTVSAYAARFVSLSKYCSSKVAIEKSVA